MKETNSTLGPATDNKVAWLTGASSGLGLELSQQLCQQGYTVIGSARRQDELQALREEIGPAFIPLPADISDDGVMYKTAEQLASLTPRLDLVLLNAGVCHYIDNVELSLERFRHCIDTNVLGAVRCLHIALPLLRRAQSGHIVAISSLTTAAAFPRSEAYGASKAALTYFLESLRADLSRETIDITVVKPGFIDTPMTAANDFPMPFTLPADEVARRILQKLSKRPYQIIVPRRLYYLLSLCSLFPAIWFELLAPRLTRNNARG